MIFRLQFSYEIRAVNVGNITQNNNGRTRLTEKTNRKQITWRHYIVFLRQYLPPTLLLLKGYRKFVSRIQPRCWILQITILENDHRISCVSLQLSSEQKPLFILIELYFMKRHIWRVSYFSSEHKPLFIPIGLCFMKRHVWSVSYFSSEHKPLFISIGLCFMKRHIRKVSYFSSEYKLLFIPIGLCFMKRHVQSVSYFSSEHKPVFMKKHVCFMKRHVWRVSYFFL